MLTIVREGDRTNLNDMMALLIPLWLPIYIVSFRDNSFREGFSSKILVILKILLIVHLSFLLMLNFGVDIYDFTILILLKSEMVDSGNYFFLNSFVYYLVGFWLSVYVKQKFNSVFILLFIIGIIITGQRGMILSFSAAYIFYRFRNGFSAKSFFNFLLVIGCLLILTIFFYDNVVTRDFQGSDDVRMQTAEQVLQSLSWFSLIFGSGIGVGVPIRPIHMENFWLEIFHKQGLLGMMCQLVILIPFFKCTFKNYAFSSSLGAWYYGLFSILLLSMTNPYYGNYYGYILLLIFTGYYIGENYETRLRNRTI